MKKTRLCRQTMVLEQEIVDKDHLKRATKTNWFNIMLQAIGEYQAVCPYIEKPVGIDKKIGEEQPDFASSMIDSAILNFNEANYVEALELMELAHTIWLKTLGPNHPHTKGCVQGLEFVQKAYKNQEAWALHEQFA